MKQKFTDDDVTYLDWLDQHPNGYVINAQRNESPTDMVLHRATCKSIRELRGNAKAGGFTERAYIKICDTDVESLQMWFQAHRGADHSLLRECTLCKPV